jgi:hypothetical protein
MRNAPVFVAVAALIAPLAMASATPVLSEQEGPAGEIGLDEFRDAIAELRALMLRPGERVEGWDRGGANPDADLRARGADSHYFLSRGRDGTSVHILTSRPIADFASAAWRPVDSYGAASAELSSPQLDFFALSARYVMATRSQFHRVRDVDCQDNLSHALLYEVPGAPESPGDEELPILFRMTILALEDQRICVRTDGDAERGYRSRMFLPDGRSLPELDDPGGLMTIVPAAPVDQLIEPPPPPLEGEPDRVAGEGAIRRDRTIGLTDG